jgi:hypothetical protein
MTCTYLDVAARLSNPQILGGLGVFLAALAILSIDKRRTAHDGSPAPLVSVVVQNVYCAAAPPPLGEA